MRVIWLRVNKVGCVVDNGGASSVLADEDIAHIRFSTAERKFDGSLSTPGWVDDVSCSIIQGEVSYL